MKIQKIFLFILIVFTLGSCKSGLEYRDYFNENTTIPPLNVQVANLENSRRMAIILPPDHNNINWKNNSLVKKLVDHDFGIMITRTYTESSDLDKQNWISYTYGAYQGLREDSLIPYQPEKLLIIAFEDGGYIIPELSRFLKPDFFIAVNTGAYNPLKELELTLKDTAVSMDLFLKRNNVLDKGELEEKIEKVKKNDPYAIDLGYKNNHYWLSFYEDNLYKSLNNSAADGLFIYSESFPALRTITVPFMKSVLLPGTIDSTVVEIPGKGIFSEPDEMESLSRATELYFNSLR